LDFLLNKYPLPEVTTKLIDGSETLESCLKFHHTWRQRAITPMPGLPRFCGPNKQPSNRTTKVKGCEEFSDLIPVQDITALKFG
jgi:hypothetical protein